MQEIQGYSQLMTGIKMPGVVSHFVVSSSLYQHAQMGATVGNFSGKQAEILQKVGRGVTSFAKSAPPGADTPFPETGAKASLYWKSSE